MPISDWSESELWVVKSTTRQGFGKPVSIEQATCEIRLNKDSRDLVEYPALFWEDDHGTHYVISKLDDHRYKVQFYRRDSHRHGQRHNSNEDEYDNIGDSVTHLLKQQAA